MDSLWRAMNVIEGGQGTREEAKEVRDKVVTAVEERWRTGELQESLRPGETGWQAYIQKMVQGRRMGGAPEIEAWAMGDGYMVKVYRETKDGAGYRKIQEYGEEKGLSVGILSTKTRVYKVVWGQEGEVKRSTAFVRDGEGNGKRGKWKRQQCDVQRRLTCGVGSVGSTEGNETEQQRKAAWAWKRREEALEGARERTGDGVLVEHMYGKDVDSKWAVLCALEGRLSSEEELQKIRQGVAARGESRHMLGAIEECLPREEVSWQKYIQRSRQGGTMGGRPEVEAWAAEGGYKVAVYRETKSGEEYRKLVEYTFDFTGHKVGKTRILSKWLTKLTHLCCVLSLF